MLGHLFSGKSETETSVAATRDSSPSSRLEVIDLSRVESSHWCDLVRLWSLGKSTSSTWSRSGRYGFKMGRRHSGTDLHWCLVCRKPQKITQIKFLVSGEIISRCPTRCCQYCASPLIIQRNPIFQSLSNGASIHHKKDEYHGIIPLWGKSNLNWPFLCCQEPQKYISKKFRLHRLELTSSDLKEQSRVKSSQTLFEVDFVTRDLTFWVVATLV